MHNAVNTCLLSVGLNALLFHFIRLPDCWKRFFQITYVVPKTHAQRPLNCMSDFVHALRLKIQQG